MGANKIRTARAGRRVRKIVRLKYTTHSPVVVVLAVPRAVVLVVAAFLDLDLGPDGVHLVPVLALVPQEVHPLVAEVEVRVRAGGQGQVCGVPGLEFEAFSSEVAEPQEVDLDESG